MEIKNERVIMSALMDLSMADTMGEVNEALLDLCKGLGVIEPKWDDEKSRYILPFEDEYWADMTGN
jgi:hypothetical protein